MSRHLRRFEVLLPLFFNSGERVPAELLEETRKEIQDQFGAISFEGQVIRGFDRKTGAAEDRTVRFFADVPDTGENFAFFLALKKRLKTRFQQEEIWIATFLVEVI